MISTVAELDAAAERTGPNLDGLLAALGAVRDPAGWVLTDVQLADLVRRVYDRAQHVALGEAVLLVRAEHAAGRLTAVVGATS